MWRDLLKCSRQTLQQPSATEDDILPMGSKELFVKRVGRESKILFNGCMPGTSVLWAPVDQDAVHVHHQSLNGQGSPSPG